MRTPATLSQKTSDSVFLLHSDEHSLPAALSKLSGNGRCQNGIFRLSPASLRWHRNIPVLAPEYVVIENIRDEEATLFDSAEHRQLLQKVVQPGASR